MKTYNDIVQSLQELAKIEIQANNLRNKENKLAGEFYSWFSKKGFWREFILKMIAESSTLTKYKNSLENIKKSLFDQNYPCIKDIDPSTDGSGRIKSLELTLAIMNEQGEEEFIETGFFNIDCLTHIDDPSYYDLDDSDIQSRIERKEKRIDHYQKKLLELQEMIKREEDEINCIKSWKNLGV
jgi:hypothetical protein